MNTLDTTIQLLAKEIAALPVHAWAIRRLLRARLDVLEASWNADLSNVITEGN